MVTPLLSRFRYFGLTMALACALPPSLHAVDFTKGLTTAVPVKDGRAPVIDGDLSDWDLSAAEPVYIAEQTIDRMNADWAFMYDADAFYVSARVAMPGRPYTNPNNPQDSFWWSDLVQLRMSADPAVPHPLDPNRDKDNARIAHISLWQNSQTGVNHLHLVRGVKLNLEQVVNPPGSTVVFKTDADRGYVVEARIPWAALNAPGGKNPFKPGDRGAFIMETLWIGGDPTRVAAGYSSNPGTFAFMTAPKWGQIEFAPASLGARRRPTLEKLIADIKAARAQPAASVGVPFQVEVPEDGLKASVNIFGPNGEVLRELIGATPVPKGALTLRWDGRDAWGHPLAPGSYRWGAYFHKGLRAEYAGSVGSSGQTAYNTQDGKGGWGGDHSNPIAASADSTGCYFLWPVAEAGKALVKTDHDGKVLWRVTPFVGGGFGPFYGVASDEARVYLVRGDGEKGVYLSRLDANTGALLTWGEGGPSEMLIHKTEPALVPELAATAAGHKKDAPAGQVYAPDSTGFALHKGRAYVTSFAGNKVYVVEVASGKVTGSIDAVGPRGVAVAEDGRIYVACYVVGRGGAVLRFDSPEARPVTLVSSGLEAPHGIAIDAKGRLHVSDLGTSQQIKVFSSSGQPLRVVGKKGGRAWQGAYDGSSFLKPAGLAIDGRGGLLVAESSPPRVFSRLSVEDGQVLGRWYGAGVYFNSTWPMPDDPRLVFYMLGEAIGRGRVAGPDAVGAPDAYWNPAKAGFPHVGDIENGIPHPEVFRATNDRLYLVRDAREHTIYVFEPDETLRPVAFWRRIQKTEAGNTLGKDHWHVWIDADGDGRIQSGEETRLAQMPDGKPIPEAAGATGSMHMTAGGDLYFMTHRNCIIKVPAAGFGPNGLLRWDLAKMSLAVPEVLPGAKELSTTWRHGLLGVRIDTKRNLYTLLYARVPGQGGAFDYIDAATATAMREGMGHTASFNVVKFAKFSPDGKLIWMARRKAVAGEQPGEMYHFWNMAGLVNDRYIAGGSEWGRIYFYTQDGFYVDALMNNPGDAPLPGPYTFGGETSGGRVQYFPATGELWAYSTGGAYRVNGFSKGAVEGEQRFSGTVHLDKVYTSPTQAAAVASAPIQIVPLNGQGLTDAAAWAAAPASVLKLRSGVELARAQLGYNAQFLLGRIEVTDDTPLQNEATEAQLAFKGGDTAGIVLGPGANKDKPGAGDIRLMVAIIRNQPRLIAMKAVTRGAKQPFEYTTPAAGTVAFEFVGEVPGGKVHVQKHATGYTATFAVPRSFLEFELKPGVALRGDIEVRLSGAGQRGIQTISRNYLFTPSRTETSMVDDIPTEARLYPAYWGGVDTK